MSARAADALVATLVANGVDTVFGIPGVHSLPIYDALVRDGSMRHVLARHEQGAGFMAEGYARVAGKVGVALVTSGPALTNVATPLASAYTDSVPLLVIATDIAAADRDARRGVLHELKDADGVAASVAGWHRRVEHADEVVPAVRDAIAHLTHERPRGAVITIPYDLLRAEVKAIDEPMVAERKPAVGEDAGENAESADRLDLGPAAEVLTASTRPLIVVGAGMRGAEAELGELAELLNAPVLLGPKGRDVMADHPYAVSGRLFAVPPAVDDLINTCDATLVLGTKLAAERTRDGALVLPAPLVQIDLDPGEIGRTRVANVGVVADGPTAVRAMLAELAKRPQPQRIDPSADVAAAREAIHASTRAWVGDVRADWVAPIRDALPQDAVVVADMTMVGYASADLMTMTPGGRFIHPYELCAIGCGLPTALGAKAAAGERAVAVIGGDGGSLLTIGELATAAQEQLPIVYLLFNDAAYTAVAGPQEHVYGHRFATDLVTPDFVALAEAFGAAGERVERPEDLADAVQRALASGRPSVIEIPLPA